MTMGKVLRLAAALGMALVLTACSSNNSGIKKERDDALARVAALEMQLQQAQNDLMAARQKAMDDLAAKQAELDGVQGMLDQANMDLTAKQGELDAKQTELDGVQGMLDDLKANGRSEDISMINTLEGQVDTLTGERDGLQGQVNTLTGERDGLQGQVNTLTGERDGLQTSLNAANKAIMDAETALRNAGADGMDLAELVASVVKTLTDAQDELDKAARAVNIAETAMVYGWLSRNLVSETPVDLTGTTPDILQQGATATPDDAMGGNTRADPKVQAWGFTYNPSINMLETDPADAAAMRLGDNWSKARVTSVVTTDGALMATASATFDDVAGTLKCDGSGGTACTITVNDKGVRTASAGAWTFEPTGGSAADHGVKDDEYVSFSYWLAMDDEDMPTGFHVSYAPTGLTLRSTFPAETDADDHITATYSGSAGGKYVTRDITGYGMKGYFTADAMLSATLRNAVAASGDDPAILAATVKGSISNIMDGDNAPLGNMSVSLDANLNEPSTGVFSGETSSKTDALGLGSGIWQATFYGGADAAAPEEAAGAFTFSWGLGAIAGGFAVEKDDE